MKKLWCAFSVLASLSTATLAVTPISKLDLEKRTDCMASLSAHAKDDHQELITVVRAPGGVPLRVEGGGHICTPYEPGVVEDVQMRGAEKLQHLMEFCGLRLGAISEADTRHAMQQFYLKMIEREPSFRSIFQQADSAKSLCP